MEGRSFRAIVLFLWVICGAESALIPLTCPANNWAWWEDAEGFVLRSSQDFRWID
jgi:hypothetical protein